MIYIFDKYCKLINSFNTQEETAVALNTSQATVSKGLNGKQKYVKKFIVIQTEKEPYEALMEHIIFYQIPFYNSGYIVTSTVTGDVIWKSLSIAPLAKKLNFKNLQCLHLVNSAHEGKFIKFKSIVYFDDFDKILI